MKHRIENIIFSSFFIVSLTLIFKKPIQQQTGPSLPLLILIIPIFGLTRMRFTLNCILGWIIFFLYLIVQLVSLAMIQSQEIKFSNSTNGASWKYDTSSDIIYQTINYGMAIIGGMVSHYRQELLRRRNYALKLPFTGLSNEEPLDLFGESFSVSKVFNRTTLKVS